MRAYMTIRDVMPSPTAELGDIKSPLLTLPSFITEQWVAENISFSPLARWALAIQAKDISNETGAHFEELMASGFVTPRDVLGMLRYPLFLRSVAARSAAADPVRMGSYFSIIRFPVERFLVALTENAQYAKSPNSIVDMARAIMENGTPEQVQAAVEMFGLCALLLPFAGIEGLIKDYRQVFGDVATFIEDVDPWMAAANQHRKERETPSTTLFRNYYAFVPPKRIASEFRVSIAGASEAAVRLGVPSWIGIDAEMLNMVRAAAPGIAEDIGMEAPSGLMSDAKVLEFMENGLSYPFFMASLSTRACLLDARRFPTWTSFFADKGSAAMSLAAAVEDGGEGDVLSALMSAYPMLEGDRRVAARDWMIITALTAPTRELMEFIGSSGDIVADLGQLYQVILLRHRSLDLPYSGPNIPDPRELPVVEENISTHLNRTVN
jgi:hypothetical protein